MTATTAPGPGADRDDAGGNETTRGYCEGEAVQRRRRPLAESRGNADLHVMIRLAYRLQRMARAFLRRHPAGCRCDCCRGLGRRYADFLREDLTGLEWLIGLAIAPVESLVVPDRLDRTSPAADPAAAADEPTAVVLTHNP